jgi:glycosyltransferase involved in cell wall biosynthesis
MIDAYRDAGYDITEVNHREIIGEDRTYTPAALYERYNSRHSGLMELYRQVTTLAATHDVLMVIYDNVYTPEFLQSLRGIYKVYFCADDPEGADVWSKPYVNAFDFAVAGAVNFDATTRVWQKYLEWGAKRAIWSPMGVTPDDYDAGVTADAIREHTRTVDVVYVGAADPLKVDRILQMKAALQDRFQIYGPGWGNYLTSAGKIRSTMSRRLSRTSLRMLRRDLVPTSNFYLPDEQLVPLYQRTKIGINVHESYGPCNRRLYALPANGVMQICDCAEGIDQVFEEGKEVVVYHSVAEAVDLVRYYLEHEDARKQIAIAGYMRVMRDYQDLDIFGRVLDKVKRAMREEGITASKEGKSL